MTCVGSAEARRAAASGAARRRGSCLQEGAVPPYQRAGGPGRAAPRENFTISRLISIVLSILREHECDSAKSINFLSLYRWISKGILDSKAKTRAEGASEKNRAF